MIAGMDLRFASVFDSKLQASKWVLQTLERASDPAAESMALSRTLWNMLRAAQVYAWDRAIVAIVDASLDALPSDAFFSPSMSPSVPTAEMPSASVSWWWIDGVSDGKGGTTELGILFAFTADGSVLFAPFGRGLQGWTPAYGCWLVGPDVSVSDVGAYTVLAGLETDEKRDRALAVTQLTAAGLSWIAQRILVAEPQRLERHLRRRLAQQPGAPDATEMRIIALRRKYYAQQAPHADDADAIVEWRCRWFVSGHWRNQYYPSAGEHRLCWVMPYLKGPEDRPIKPPSSRLFAVIR
jgi:hypothetical protein